MTFPFYDYDSDFFSTEDLLFLAGASGKAVEVTATGNPLVFTTDLARPLKSLLIPFTPKQSGTGDPSPQNVRPLVPWNGLKVFGGGKSLFPFVRTEYEATSNYNGYDTQNAIPDAFIGHKLTYSAYFDNTNSAESSSVKIWGKDKNDSWIWLGNAGNEIGAGAKGTSYKTILIPQNVAWIAFGMMMKAGSKYSQPMVELGETATAYEPYAPITETDISFPSPVYGGEHEAVSGKLMSFYALLTKNTAEMNNNEDYPGWKNSGVENIVGTGVNELLRNVLTNVSPVSSLSVGANTAYGSDVLYLNKSFFNKTQSEWIALAIDVQILVPLATPQEITLTPQQITALVGDNTIWSDADGSMTAVYLKKG